jgi:hypothetical protein
MDQAPGIHQQRIVVVRLSYLIGNQIRELILGQGYAGN